ncbi:MAG: DUF3159 domain-containing protein [Segniliparus sp.]|uniref:DUF3159 domain-containing protein n=1 Tax=Segniliparus sp. TaxID=2804064 RepID=UPI003F3ACDEC
MPPRPPERDAEGPADSAAPWRVAADRLGGAPALVQAVAPTAVFAVVSATAGLAPAAVAAAGAGIAVVAGRAALGLPARPALLGLVLLVVSLCLALNTGKAEDFYAIGIWTSLGVAVAGLASIAARRPLMGYLWGWALGHGLAWRRADEAVRAFSWATGATVLVHLARFAVQQSLYRAGHVGWLAAARLVMGWPLTVAVLVAVYPLIVRADNAIRRSGADGPALPVAMGTGTH